MTAPLGRLNSYKYRRPKVRAIVAVAEAVKNVLVETGGIDPKRIHVVYGSVDTSVFHPDVAPALRQELNAREDQPVVGYLGSSSARKGLNYLFESMVMVSQRFPDALFVVVGVDEARLNKRGFPIPDTLREKLTLIPFREDVANCMASFDVLLFSGIRNEGLTGTLREACAVGTPVVTTDVGGNAELILDDERGGRVVPIADPAAMADAACDLLDNPDHAKDLGKRGCEWVHRNMINEVRADQIESIYRKLIDDA